MKTGDVDDKYNLLIIFRDDEGEQIWKNDIRNQI